MTEEERNIDVESRQKRVHEILNGEAPQTLHEQLRASVDLTRTRAKRKDAGIPRKPPADPDEIVLRVSLEQARRIAILVPDASLGAAIQDQIIAQLQKRLDAFLKQK